MVRYLRLSLFSFAVLTLGLALQFWRAQQSLSSKAMDVTSLEAYWQQTDLSLDKAEDLINEKSCASSERYFLSCINGLNLAGAKSGKQLSFAGRWMDLSEGKVFESEKEQLSVWQSAFRADPLLAAKIPFSKLLKGLVLKNQKSSAMLAGLAINGFISVFRDPHTYLIPLDYYNEVVAQTDSKSSALGLVLAKVLASQEDPAKQQYFIRKVLEFSPAQQAGIEKGDLLLEVQGHSVVGLPLSQISELMRGQVGERINIVLERSGVRLEKSILRSVSRIPSVTGRVLSGIQPVGVLTVNKFATGTCEKASNELATLMKQGIRGLLLDLRDNPGGQMEEASCLAGLFLGPDKKVFELRYLDPAKGIESYSSGVEQQYGGALAVLVNSGSASASEIVAGALKDWGRAVLVGERTFGKGSFQEGEIWSENEKLALFQTRGFYYLPSGKSPQLYGIEPDIEVSFRASLVQRESDQFWSPLRAPARKPWVGNLALSERLNIDDCVGLEDFVSEDVEIEKAKDSLFCMPRVAGAEGDL